MSDRRLRGRALLWVLLLGSGAPLAGPLVAQPPAVERVATAPLDINSATEAELVALKHVGKRKAKRILKGRPWRQKDELVEQGILTPGEYAEIKDRIVARRP